MKLSKIKRALSAVLAAALCITAVVAIPASAAKKTVWQESKELAGAKYNSKYITWVEKYSEKDSKTTVAYSKSRTKKLMDKLAKAAEKDTPQLSYCMINKETIMYTAVKGDKFKAVGYTYETGMAYCGNSKTITFFDVNDKEKSSEPISESDFILLDAETFTERAVEGFYLFFIPDISDEENGKLFKFTSGEKTYYYEEFDKYGFLFNESGTILAGISNGEGYCVNVSYKVDDSVFDVPQGYKTAELEDIDWL